MCPHHSLCSSSSSFRLWRGWDLTVGVTNMLLLRINCSCFFLSISAFFFSFSISFDFLDSSFFFAFSSFFFSFSSFFLSFSNFLNSFLPNPIDLLSPAGAEAIEGIEAVDQTSVSSQYFSTHSLCVVEVRERGRERDEVLPRIAGEEANSSKREGAEAGRREEERGEEMEAGGEEEKEEEEAPNERTVVPLGEVERFGSQSVPLQVGEGQRRMESAITTTHIDCSYICIHTILFIKAYLIVAEALNRSAAVVLRRAPGGGFLGSLGGSFSSLIALCGLCSLRLNDEQLKKYLDTPLRWWW